MDDEPRTPAGDATDARRHHDRRGDRPWTRSRPLVGRPAVDAALAVAAAGFALVVLALGGGVDGPGEAPARAYVVAVVATAPLVFRRVEPVAVLVVVAIGRVVVTWDAGSELVLMPAVALALYTVARHGDHTVARRGDRRSGLIAATAVAVVMALALAAGGDDGFLLELVGEGAQGLLPIAVGDAVRARDDRLRDLIDAEADARVQAERLRIARDLHDVVAHGLSTIAVQSGVASHLLDREPERAREALDVINTTGRASLEELRAMVGVLRSTGDTELRPAPTDRDDLGDLLASATRAGIEVTHRIEGAFPADVGDAAVVAVHRIVQEALTNVARHAGPVAATVTVTHGDDGVAVEVVNDRPAEARPVVASTGVGIVGMRERAQSLGGSLDAGSTGAGGFRVAAIVPYHRRQP